MKNIIATPDYVDVFHESVRAEKDTVDPYQYVKQRNNAWREGGSLFSEAAVGYFLYSYIRLILPTVFILKVIFHFLER